MKTFAIKIQATPSSPIVSAELYDPNDIDLSISGAIADANNLGVGKATSTKSVELPGSLRNQISFGYPEDFNSVVNISQDNRVRVWVTADETQIFVGYGKMQMATTQRTNNENSIKYTLNFIGTNKDWVSLMIGKRICDLDYSDQNHTNNIATVNGSETIAPGREYVYDLIDRGAMHGHDYTDATGIIRSSVSIMDRMPAISYSSLWDRIWLQIGYKMVCNFRNSDFFKKLYWTFVEDFLKHPGDFNAKCKGEMDLLAGETTYIFPLGTIDTAPNIASVPCNFTSNTVLYETAGEFNFNQHGQMFAKGTAHYKLKFTADFSTRDIDSNNDTTSPDYGELGNINLTFYKRNFYKGITNTVVCSNDSTSAIIPITFPIGPAVWADYLYVLEKEFDLDYGDELFVRADILFWPSTPASRFRWNPGTIFEVVDVIGDMGMGENQLVDMNTNLSKELQLDFIASLRDEYNLMFTTDIDSRTIYCEPFDDFYNQTPEDWSELIDRDQDQSVIFTGSDLSKKMRYKYKNDTNDKITDQYNTMNIVPFGAVDITVNNAFAKDGTAEFENTLMAATWMSNCTRIGILTPEIPRMWSDITLPPFSTKFLPRTLFYDGIQALPDGESWRMNHDGKSDYELAHPAEELRKNYPHFYSFDNSVPNNNNLQYSDEFTSSGLEQKFYRRKQRMIDGGIQYQCNIWINDLMMSKLDFRKPKILSVDGNKAVFILNSFSNFRSQDSISTQCLFLKLIDIPTIKPPAYIVGVPFVPYTGGGVRSTFSVGPDGRSILISGREVARISPDGDLIKKHDTVFTEIDGIVMPVYFTDTDGIVKEVVI